MPYPPNWRPCPHCSAPAMDGKATCGQAACMQQEARRPRVQGPLTCLASRDDGTLCGEVATTVDPARMIMVCPEHAPKERAEPHG